MGKKNKTDRDRLIETDQGRYFESKKTIKSIKFVATKVVEMSFLSEKIKNKFFFQSRMSVIDVK